MGTLIQPGQLLVGGQQAGQLNQYYGYADTNVTTVTQASLTSLCTAYTIPAGEAYAGASYELSCGGYGEWGSTQEKLTFETYMGTAFGSAPAVAAAAISVSTDFTWWLVMKMTCADGISEWYATLEGAVCVSSAAVNPGTASTNAIPIAGCNSGAHTADTDAAITCVIQAEWGSSSVAATISTTRTTFRKVA